MTRWLELAGDLLFVQQPASRECYYPTGEAVRAGERFRIPHLDETLDAVAREGVSTLYTGDLAEAFAREMRENGGLVTREDLAAYRALVRKPLRLESGGFTLALNPPPAVGGAAVGSLIRLIERGWKQGLSPAELSLLHARAQAEFLQLREREIASPAFDESRARALLEGDHLRKHAGKLDSPSTTHLSVATEDGWLVSATLSMGYGAGITIPGTGIACANSLGEPELNPQGFLKAAPGSRIISNMAPTLAWHTDGRALGIGSPGASRITTSIAQTWVRFGLEGATLEEAVRDPRLHVERRDDGLRVQCEPGIDTSLLEKEFFVRHFDAPDMYFGAVKLAGVDRDGRLHAIADERRHGGTRIV
jgi:gamma-glutamyltranspeptidase/glutathione hydrolase